MRTRDGKDIDVRTCPSCGGYYSGAACPVCHPRQTAGNSQKTAIGTDPSQDTDETREPVARGTEAVLQGEIEQWLQFVGYWPRDRKHIEAGKPPRGWYVHVHQCQGNPYLLDLLVLDFSRGWVEGELKTGAGRLSEVQAAIVDANGWHSAVLRNADDTKDWLRERLDIPEV